MSEFWISWNMLKLELAELQRWGEVRSTAEQRRRYVIMCLYR